ILIVPAPDNSATVLSGFPHVTLRMSDSKSVELANEFQRQLRSKIKSLYREGQNHHYFIPEKALRSVMARFRIQDALVAKREQKDEIAQKILQQGAKIFGVLILVEIGDTVVNFIEAEELEDARLPFTMEVLVKTVGLTDAAAQDFEKSQWDFLSPTFVRGTLNRRLRPKVILPFLKDESKDKDGNFGHIFEVTLVAEHQDTAPSVELSTESIKFPEVTLPNLFKFLRKELDYQYDHEAELQNLAILHKLKHPNIVELLGSFTYRGKHNILFPLAEAGDLQSLLEKPREGTSLQSDESLLMALSDLASAIAQVHNCSTKEIDLELIGLHHDLRPRNILVSGNRFILADFGLSTFKGVLEDSETSAGAVVGDYIAPECEDLNRVRPRSFRRSSDIWSFGCIISEIITYMLFGHQGVKDFRDARIQKVRIFTIKTFYDGSNTSDSGRFRDLVDLIRIMLSIEQSERPSAEAVRERLCRITLRNNTGRKRDFMLHSSASMNSGRN
ncbi:hypothetical protein SLS63_004667, partial [Diaporthe eres]